MNPERRAERILAQGQALVRAIGALETVAPTGPMDRVQVWFLLQAYQRRLRAIVGAAPAWLAEAILSATQAAEGDQPVVRLANN